MKQWIVLLLFFCVLPLYGQKSVEKAVLSLIDLYQTREDWSRESVLQTLKTMGLKALPILSKVVKGKDYLKSLTALEMLTTYEEPAALKEISECLKKVQDWRVKVSIIQVMSQRKDKSSLIHLIETMDREEGRVLNDTIDALHSISGKKFGADSVQWRKWIAGELPDESFEGKSIPLYFDLAVYSKRVVFVMDISYSMSWGDRRKIAEKNLVQTLQSLEKDVVFNVILFGDQIQRWKPKLVPVNPRNIRNAAGLLKKIRLKPGTNTFGALETAFQLKGVDTIFFLSDGYPTFGRFRKPEEILKELAKLNRFRKIRINTVGIFRGGPPKGYEDSEPDKKDLKKFMKELAEANFGKYHFIQ